MDFFAEFQFLFGFYFPKNEVIQSNIKMYCYFNEQIQRRISAFFQTSHVPITDIQIDTGADSLPSALAKNSESVIWKASQIFTSEGMVGIALLLYHVEMVEVFSSAWVAKSYSDHLRSSR